MTDREKGLSRAWYQLLTIFEVHTRCSVYGLRKVALAISDLVFWATDRHTNPPLSHNGARMMCETFTVELSSLAGALFASGKSFDEARDIIKKEAWRRSVTL